jgi:hypothetical protein
VLAAATRLKKFFISHYRCQKLIILVMQVLLAMFGLSNLLLTSSMAGVHLRDFPRGLSSSPLLVNWRTASSSRYRRHVNQRHFYLDLFSVGVDVACLSNVLAAVD